MARKLFTIHVSYPIGGFWTENNHWDIEGIFNRKPDHSVEEEQVRTVRFNSLRARTVARRVAELVCLDIEGLVFTIQRQ